MAFGDGVVSVKTFGVDHSQLKCADTGSTSQGQIQAACRVFAEHQVLPVGEGEGLFVCAFHGGLYGGAEGSFSVIDDHAKRKLINEVVEVKVQLCCAALAVRRGKDALGRAKPCQNVGVL